MIIIITVPEAPLFAHQPSYYWIQSENMLKLNVAINETVLTSLFDTLSIQHNY